LADSSSLFPLHGSRVQPFRRKVRRQRRRRWVLPAEQKCVPATRTVGLRIAATANPVGPGVTAGAVAA